MGVGRKPPFVLNDILLSVLPTGSLDNCDPKFGLAPGQMTRFNNSSDDLNSKPVSSQYQRLWRFCDSARDSRPYYLHSNLIQNEGGLSSATTNGHRQSSTYAQHKPKEKNPYKTLATHIHWSNHGIKTSAERFSLSISPSTITREIRRPETLKGISRLIFMRILSNNPIS